MITVLGFLCWDLETGGIVIGWFNLILSSISLALMAFWTVIVLFVGCDEFNLNRIDTNCGGFKPVVIVSMLIICLILIGLIYASRLLLKGVRERNHDGVRPMMILSAISFVFFILSIFNSHPYQIGGGIVGILINGYCFLVLYSLYEKFRIERELGMTQQQYPNLEPGAKV